MKLPLPHQLGQLTILATIILTSLPVASPSPAVTFGQQEVEQSQIIAIARPYGGNQYDLLILQQIPGQRQCWSESGSNPVTVEPLLLNFDFTGICERSTDSNGYSIRIDGQDYGLDYLLRIVKRNGELVLVGTHRTDSRQPEIAVGSTQGIAPGFLKISLAPGWRFTKRIYEGQALSHIYLTGERSAMQTPENSAATATAVPPGDDSPGPTETIRELTFTAGESPSPPSPVSPSPLPSFSQLPPLPPPTPAVNSEVVPPPPVNSTANPHRKGLSDVLSVQPRPLPGGSSNGGSHPDRLAVPAAPLPTGGGYRVMVAARDRSQQTQLRSLYPDAFPTTYSGRSLWQIGVFSSRDNADSALQNLQILGLEGMVIQR